MSTRLRSARLLRAAIGKSGPVEPTEADWEFWTAEAIHHRMIPLLHQVVSNLPDDVDPGRVEAVEQMQLDVMGTMVRFEHDLLDLAPALTEACRFAVLKGAATAHLDYSDPAMRQFGDIDLLMAPEDFTNALTVLAELGWVQAYPLPRHHERFTHAITVRNGRRVEIDVHQRIAHRAVGELVPSAELLADGEDYAIAGVQFRALRAPDRVIHSALHAAMSRGEFSRLSSVADVLVLSRKHQDSAREVLERAEAWRVRSLVERAVTSAHHAAELPVPTPWRTAMASPHRKRDRLVDAAYLGHRRRPLIEELAYLRLMPGLRDRVEYLGGYFTTDADYAARNRRRGVVAQTRYLWSRVRSGRSW